MERQHRANQGPGDERRGAKQSPAKWAEVLQLQKNERRDFLEALEPAGGPTDVLVARSARSTRNRRPGTVSFLPCHGCHANFQATKTAKGRACCAARSPQGRRGDREPPQCGLRTVLETCRDEQVHAMIGSRRLDGHEQVTSHQAPPQQSSEQRIGLSHRSTRQGLQMILWTAGPEEQRKGGGGLGDPAWQDEGIQALSWWLYVEMPWPCLRMIHASHGL